MYGVKTGGFDTVEQAEAYFDGVADGLRVYAWQRDGTMYVGTTGSTLAEAQNELDAARKLVVGRLKESEKEREATKANETGKGKGKGDGKADRGKA